MTNNDFPLDLQVLKSVLDYLNLGVYITGSDRRIMLWNRKAEEITGHKAADVVGKHCHDDILMHVDTDGHPLCSTQLCPLHRSIILNKESEKPVLVFATRADGTRVALTVNTAPLKDAQGNVIGGIEAFYDQTGSIQDLQFARRVQRALMPETLPQPRNIRFEVCYCPHDLIGGDFYDVRQVAAGKYGFIVADVRGHGVSAALYTVLLKELAEQNQHLANMPHEFIGRMNQGLSKYVVDESFATAFYGMVDDQSGLVLYTNAGHCVPFHYSPATGEVVKLETHGLPLGILDEDAYESDTIALHPGDILFCYTDGILEVTDRDGNMIGDDGLIAILKQELRAGSENLLDRTHRQVKHQCGEITLADDVLLMSVERLDL